MLSLSCSLKLTTVNCRIEWNGCKWLVRLLTFSLCIWLWVFTLLTKLCYFRSCPCCRLVHSCGHLLRETIEKCHNINERHCCANGWRWILMCCLSNKPTNGLAIALWVVLVINVEFWNLRTVISRHLWLLRYYYFSFLFFLLLYYTLIYLQMFDISY